ncbi:hypothetical protein D9756_004772 [Leucocoprinus leucothites]|uniref:DUF6534 domain-containing protein n=1 Tax=Leucocoprinus leucothites TaxID=201217 RepID=A0A8H5G9N4_9AGAR|nr:hypothetical protein D9756_004772 [Leucoagaricus leucothites]
MAVLDATYGSIFIGLIIASVLYGVTLLQTFLYYRSYPKDSNCTKILVCSCSYYENGIAEGAKVAVVWLLDTTQLILCTVAMYWYLVQNFTNEEALRRTTWSMNLQTDCNGLIGLIVECFFARRVWIMSGNAILTLIIVRGPPPLSLPKSTSRSGPIGLCSFRARGWYVHHHFFSAVQPQVYASPVFTIEECVNLTLLAEEFFAKMTLRFLLVENTRFFKLIWVTSAGLGSAAAADVIIACALCYYLLKSRTGFSSTDSLIATLIAYSLTTGLITSVLALICVVTVGTAFEDDSPQC